MLMLTLAGGARRLIMPVQSGRKERAYRTKKHSMSNLEDLALIRRPDVERLTALSRTTIYRLMDDGAFPRPLKLGARAVAWRAAEIREWLTSRERGGACGKG